jgi:hypothetical protein
MFADGTRFMLHVPTKYEWTEEKIEYMRTQRQNDTPWFLIARELGLTMGQCQRKFARMNGEPVEKKGKWSNEEEKQLVIDYVGARGDLARVPLRGRTKEAVRSKLMDLETSGRGNKIWSDIQLGTDG